MRQLAKMDSFEADILLISKMLDRIEAELEMNKEAVESIEMRLRLLNTELDFHANKNDIID